MMFRHLSLAIAATLALAPGAASARDADACHGRRSSILGQGARLIGLDANQLADVNVAEAAISRLCSDNHNAHAMSPVYIQVGACERTYVEMVRTLRAADSRVNEACDQLRTADQRSAECKKNGQADCYAEAARLYREVKTKLESADQAVVEGQAALDKAREMNDTAASEYATYLMKLSQFYKRQREADTEAMRQNPRYVNPRGFGVPDEAALLASNPDLNPKAVTGDASFGDIFRKSGITGTVDENSLQTRAQYIFQGLDNLKRNTSTISIDPSRHASRFGMLASQQLAARTRAQELSPILTTADREIRAGVGGLDKMARDLDRFAASSISLPTSPKSAERPDVRAGVPASAPTPADGETPAKSATKVASTEPDRAAQSSGALPDLGLSRPKSAPGADASSRTAAAGAATAANAPAAPEKAKHAGSKTAAPGTAEGTPGTRPALPLVSVAVTAETPAESPAKAFRPGGGEQPSPQTDRRPAATGSTPSAKTAEGKAAAGAAVANGTIAEAGMQSGSARTDSGARELTTGSRSAGAGRKDSPSPEAVAIADKELAVLSREHPIASESLRARLRERLARAADQRLRDARERETGTSASVVGNVLRGAAEGSFTGAGTSYRAAPGGMADEDTLLSLASATTDTEVRRLLSDADDAAALAMLGAPGVSLFDRVHAAYQRKFGHAKVASE